jgi:hypothetical protein
MPKPARGYQVRLKAEQKEDVRRQYLDGVHYTQIIEQYNCSTGSFWAIVKDLRKEVYRKQFDEHVARLQQIPVEQLGWVAGIIDGEGYIGLVPNFQKGRVVGIMPRIDISSTTPIMQERLASVLGMGLLYYKRKRENRPKEKPQTSWSTWSNCNVGPLLQVILPHLVVKKPIAEIVLEHCKRRLINDMQPYTNEDLHAVDEVRRLNGRRKSHKKLAE